MSNIEIRTEGYSEGALIPRRQLRISGKTIDTPARARPARKTRSGEQPMEESRGVVELHRTIDTERLTRARRGNLEVITDELKRGYRKAHDDEVVCSFFTYEDEQTMAQGEIELMVNVLEEFSDVLPVPMMPGLVRIMEDDEEPTDPAFHTYKENVDQFVRIARTLAPDKPVMGVIPPLGSEFTYELMDLYAEYNVRAYYVNFKRRRITAETQIGVVKPMMQYIARRDIADNVLFYAINLHPGDEDETLGLTPALDMSSVGMGFDIIGENHVGIRAPPEAFEGEDDTVTFTFFDRDSYARREVLLAELPQHFPSESGFDPEHIVQRSAESDNHRRRLEKLVSAEQMALATQELHPQIPAGSAFDHLMGKPGVTPEIARALQDVRDGFEDGQSQSSLSDF